MKKNRFALLGIASAMAVEGLALASASGATFAAPIGGRQLNVDDGLGQGGGGEVAAAVQASDVQAQAEQHQQGVADVGDGVAQQQQVQTEPDAVTQQQAQVEPAGVDQQQAQADQQQAENPGGEQQV